MPLLKLTRTDEPQDSVDIGARGSGESPTRRGVLDTLAQRPQDSKRAKTLGPVWLQEVPDGDGQCGPIAGLEEAGELY
eukprot:3195396-Alexandrium_andersonii.AAC.1